ncbi:MAG: hypothetical protein HXY20_00725 [Acidobacteria bacterium]|nr:hypothetical protein [Acidobacteriota bacterium]
MPTCRSSRCIGIVALSLVFPRPAPANDYVGWSQGDSAVYRDKVTGTEVRTMAEQGGRVWVHYTNFAGFGPLWVASSARGERVYVLGEDWKIQLFADFDAPEGSVTRLDLGPCNRGAAVLAGRSMLSVPAGTFTDVMRVDFQPSCADAGITSAWFAKGVGPIQWTAATIAGPSTYQMISASIGGIRYPRHIGVLLLAEFPGPTVWLNMMPPVPKTPQTADVYLTVQNNTTEELTYTFRTGQHFEIEILDTAGQVVSRWSRGRAFIQAFNEVTILPGAQHRFGGPIELAYDDGRPLAPGHYSVRIYLTNENQPGVTPPQGSAPVDIRWAY